MHKPNHERLARSTIMTDIFFSLPVCHPQRDAMLAPGDSVEADVAALLSEWQEAESISDDGNVDAGSAREQQRARKFIRSDVKNPCRSGKPLESLRFSAGTYPGRPLSNLRLGLNGLRPDRSKQLPGLPKASPSQKLRVRPHSCG